MTKIEFTEMLDRMASGWTKRNYEKVAENFLDDLFYSDALNYSFFSKKDLLAFFRDDGGDPQFCKFYQTVYDEERQIGAAEYTYEGSFRYHGTVWVEIENDKIASWREYQHISELDRENFWKG
jgi:hypothetical protein